MTSPRSRCRGNKHRNVSPFAMLHWMVIDSQGWHDLSLASRCAYVELVRRFDGENNGRIAMPARVLGERLNRSPAHAARALRELEDAGFITCTKQGTFRRKDRLASEYRLNVLRCDSDPPDEVARRLVPIMSLLGGEFLSPEIMCIGSRGPKAVGVARGKKG
jgi:hypothetical protein